MAGNKDKEPRRNKRDMPHWAKDERVFDTAWITMYLETFTSIAREQYKAQGRGAIIVDISQIVIPSLGHPVWYLPQKEIEALRDAPDLKRMVREYPPAREMVIALLKEGGTKESIYRIFMLPSAPGLN